jgi:hypothetical protein
MKKLIVSIMFVVLISFPINGKATTILHDKFEYIVNRGQPGASSAFISGGGWSYAKTREDAAGSCGYLYTTNSIPGFSGNFPGTNSSRVLAMEFLPYTLNCNVGGGWLQTDLYLQKGGESAPQNTIPANAWFQFWIYINDYGTQQTRWHSSGTKWLYPCINGAGTCSGSNISFLHLLKVPSYNSYSLSATGANIYPVLEGNGANYTPGSEPGVWKLGHNQSRNVGLLTANQWILVKIHVDISGSSPLAPANQGVYREWHKTVGGEFVKVAEWIGGVTPNFTWNVSALASGHTIGQKGLKLGTTWNYTDGWIYLDDFVIGTSETDLPTYGGTASLTPPPNFRRIGQ